MNIAQPTKEKSRKGAERVESYEKFIRKMWGKYIEEQLRERVEIYERLITPTDQRRSNNAKGKKDTEAR